MKGDWEIFKSIFKTTTSKTLFLNSKFTLDGKKVRDIKVFLSIDESGFTFFCYIYINKFNCDDKYLIILLKCKVSLKQYVGETTVAFRLIWNNCKDNGRELQRNESCVEQHFYEHFYSQGHNGHDW